MTQDYIVMHGDKGKNPCENAGVCCCMLDMVITCAALGNKGLVTVGWAAGAAGRLGNAPVVGAGAM